MKTLTIALSMLLVVIPANAQQITAPRVPNFYVPYGIRDVPVEMESSSDGIRLSEPPQGPSGPPMPRPYPPRRGGHRQRRQGSGLYPLTPAIPTGVKIGFFVAIGLAFVAIATGDQ